jgi:DNA-binding transcriptional MerR regulator
MKIGELAAATGTSTDTLRYYERQRLLDAPTRADNGYRRYVVADVARVRFVRAAQSLGFSLAEIRVAVGQQRAGRLGRAEIEKGLHRKIAEIDAHMARLRALKKELTSAFGSLTCESPGEMALEGPAARGAAAARARGPSTTARAVKSR